MLEKTGEFYLRKAVELKNHRFALGAVPFYLAAGNKVKTLEAFAAAEKHWGLNRVQKDFLEFRPLFEKHFGKIAEAYSIASKHPQLNSVYRAIEEEKKKSNLDGELRHLNQVSELEDFARRLSRDYSGVENVEQALTKKRENDAAIRQDAEFEAQLDPVVQSVHLSYEGTEEDEDVRLAFREKLEDFGLAKRDAEGLSYILWSDSPFGFGATRLHALWLASKQGRKN